MQSLRLSGCHKENSLSLESSRYYPGGCDLWPNLSSAPLMMMKLQKAKKCLLGLTVTCT